MTREEAITALGDRNCLLWGMSKEEQKYYSEALDMAISALSAEPTCMIEKSNFSQEQYKADLQSAYDCGKASVSAEWEYIKKEEVLSALLDEENNFHKIVDIISELPTYSIPNSSDIEKIREEIEEQAYLGINDEYSHGLFEALRIIDKHIKGVSEE